MKKIIYYLLCIYILNRVELMMNEVLNQFIIIDLSSFGIQVKENKWDIDFDSLNAILIRFIPFNPFYIISILFIIPLNGIVLYTFFRNREVYKTKLTALKSYWFYMIFTYLVSYLLFFILRLLYFEEGSAFRKTGDGLLHLLCESYAPYSPTMISGFLLGNIMFSFILVYGLEPLLKKWITD